MPVYRNADPELFPRRSRRLSRQEPKHYDDDGFESFDPRLLELRHSSSDPSSESTEFSTVSSPSRSPTPYCPSPSPRSLSPSPFLSPAPYAARRLSTTSFPTKTSQNGFERVSNISSTAISGSTSSTHSRPQQPKHIPRPPNAFMIYRSHFWSTKKDTLGERDHRQISRMVAIIWNQLPEEEKEVFRREAEIVKKEHMEKFPNYRYAPIRDGGYKKSVERRKSSVGKNIKARVEVKREATAMTSRETITKKRRVQREYAEVEVKKEAEWYTKAEKNMMHDIDADAEGDTDYELDMDVDIGVKPVLHSTPQLSYPHDYHYKSQLDSDDEQDNEFVPTEDIPPLDLYTSAPSTATEVAHPVFVKAETAKPTSTPSLIPVPPSYVRIDSQFGVKHNRHRLSASPRLSSPSSSFSFSSSSSPSSASSFLRTHQDTSVPEVLNPIPRSENGASLLFSGSAIASTQISDAVPAILQHPHAHPAATDSPNAFSQSGNPDAWLTTETTTSSDNTNLHYFYGSEPGSASGSGRGTGVSVASAPGTGTGAYTETEPEAHNCFLDELLQSFQMGIGLDQDVSLNDLFDEFVVMPLPLPEEPEDWELH